MSGDGDPGHPRPVIWVTPEESRDFEISGSEPEDDRPKRGRKRQILSCSGEPYLRKVNRSTVLNDDQNVRDGRSNVIG